MTRKTKNNKPTISSFEKEANEYRRLGDKELRREKRSMSLMCGLMFIMSIVPPIVIYTYNPREQPVYAICWFGAGMLAMLIMPLRQRIHLGRIGKHIQEQPGIVSEGGQDDPDAESTLSLPPVKPRRR